MVFYDLMFPVLMKNILNVVFKCFFYNLKFVSSFQVFLSVNVSIYFYCLFKKFFPN